MFRELHRTTEVSLHKPSLPSPVLKQNIAAKTICYSFLLHIKSALKLLVHL